VPDGFAEHRDFHATDRDLVHFSSLCVST
jgi:hypothetical protein